MIIKAFTKIIRFAGDRRGNVAMITALTAIPLFGMLGFAIDYGVALNDKTKLDAAADAAAIVAITTAQTVLQGGGTFASAKAQGEAQAKAAFNANAGSVTFAYGTQANPTVSQTNQTLTAIVPYTSTMSTNFTKIIGLSTIPIGGTSTSTLSMKTYINYYIIVDISQSMGIGATATDMQNLYNLVVAYNNGNGGEVGCVFGCHATTGSQHYANEDLAHKYYSTLTPPKPVTLRIDSAVSAINSIISTAINTSGATGGPVKIGLYSMADNSIKKITDPTSDLSSLLPMVAGTSDQSTTGKYDLGPSTSAGPGDSYYSPLSTFSSTFMTPQGDGSSTKPLNYVFLITDGVQDTVCTSSTGHCTAVMDYKNNCAPIKADKTTLGVIYTTYAPIYNYNNSQSGLEGNYSILVNGIQTQIAPALQQCSTVPPGTAPNTFPYFYEASDGPSITTAMQKLFVSTISAARITQ